MLKVNNIEVSYLGVIRVLHGISLEVGDGQIVALIGANGGGKTTTLKSISGLLRVEQGQIRSGYITLNEKRIDHLGPEDVAKLGISQVLEGRRTLEHLTVEENLQVGAYQRKDRAGVKRDLEMVYDYFPKIRDYRKRVSGYLSGGEQQMVVIGRALMADPRLMLLDEPSLGLAPMAVQEIYEIIERINQERGVSMLVVEQNVKAALGIAEYGYVMENGRIVLDGPADKLRGNEDVKEFYMGISSSGSRKNYREVKHYRRRKRWLA
ncbi:MAG: ABC transporter ATP-binding protein [Actinobacteria bacterium]|nr:ABC transporter ATP-binding protein [Actinomycetota bacterium]